MKLDLEVVSLPLRHTFTITHGTFDTQPSLIVSLQEDGIRGYGEGTAIDYYGTNAKAMGQALEALRQEIESATWEEPSELWEKMLPSLDHNRFALCALDEAAHDLWGKKLGKPVYKLWGLNTDNNVPSNYTIGIDSLEKMVAKMQEFPGWPIYKIKLGTKDDLGIVKELRQHTDAVFRVDANTAWTVEETIRNSHAMAELGVEFLEQPLAAGDWEGMRQVREESALPVFADESCIREEDVERCAGYFHGVNIKLAKCGGLTPARRMVERARELDLSVMVGCMTESTIGISALAQLLPLLDHVDMDGALLLARDVAEGVRLEKGRAIYPGENGCGVRRLYNLRINARRGRGPTPTS